MPETAKVMPKRSPKGASKPSSMNAAPPKIDSKQLMIAVSRKSIWYKMASLTCILGGILGCLSIIGAIFGVPMIWAGINLYRAPDLAKKGDIKGFVNNINTYVLYVGIGELIKSGLALIGFLGLIGAAGYGIASYSGSLDTASILQQLNGSRGVIDAGAILNQTNGIDPNELMKQLNNQ